ncbi:hypothetical protein ACQY0O_004172 [Thecaphora frezii]
MTSTIVFEPSLTSRSTHRLDPQGDTPVALTFTSSVSTQQHRHTAALLDGCVRIQLWTNLACLDASTLDAVGGSALPSATGTSEALVGASDEAGASEARRHRPAHDEWRAYDLHRCPQASNADWALFRTTLTLPRSHLDNDASGTTTYGFTYRLAFPDGRMEWLSYPHQDGSIRIVCRPASSRIHDVLAFPDDVFLKDLDLDLDPGHRTGGVNASAAYVRLLDRVADGEAPLASFKPPYRSSPGIAMERTKSTWCTSRTFAHPSQISPDFAASYLLFDLEGDDAVLAVMPAIPDLDAPWILKRSSEPSADGQYRLCCRPAASRPCSGIVTVALAHGPRSKVRQVMAACREAARALVHESFLEEHKNTSMYLNGDSGYLSASASVLRSDSAASFSTQDSSLYPLSGGPSGRSSPTLPASTSAASYLDGDAFDLLPLAYESTMGLKDLLSVQNEAFSRPNHSQSSSLDAPVRPLDPKGGLGFCTWEAMGGTDRRPFLSKVVAAIESLEARFGAGCITSLLIDDGWQDVAYDPSNASHRGGLRSWALSSELLDIDDARGATIHSVAADAARADAGVPRRNAESDLARYVSYLRQRFPSVRHVGCWMTLAGYWDGVDPHGEAAARLQDGLVEVDVADPFRNARRRWFVPGSEGDLDAFWNDAFTTLGEAGIDFVKVDAQAEWDWIVPPKDGAPVSAAIAFESMHAAALRRLGPGSVLHSMSGSSTTTNSSRTLAVRGADGNAPTSLRMTDDFFPDIVEAHRYHLVHNAYNALVLAGENELRADADMFSSQCRSSSREDWASYHASFRAFSDAKLWISDAPAAAAERPEKSGDGYPSPSGVSGLLARDMRSRIGTLQATEPAQPVPSDLFNELLADGPGPALKLYSANARVGVAIVGLWNARGGEADSIDVVTPSLLEQLPVNPEADLAVYSTRTGTTTMVERAQLQNPTKCDEPLLLVSLPPAGHEGLIVAPLQSSGEVALGCLGLVDKYNGINAMATPGVFHYLEAEPVATRSESTLDASSANPGHESSSRSSSLPAESAGGAQPLSKVFALGQSRLDTVRIMVVLAINTLFQTLLSTLGYGRTARLSQNPSTGADGERAGGSSAVARALRRLQAGVGSMVVPRSRCELDGIREAYLPLITLGFDAGQTALQRPLGALRAMLNPLRWRELVSRISVAGTALEHGDAQARYEEEQRDADDHHHPEEPRRALSYKIELLVAGLVGFVVRTSAERRREMRVRVDQYDVEREGIVRFKPIDAANEEAWDTTLVTIDLEKLAGLHPPYLGDGGARAREAWEVEVLF